MDFYEYVERILWKKSTKDKIGESYEIFVYVPFEDLNNKEIRKNIFEED